MKRITRSLKIAAAFFAALFCLFLGITVGSVSISPGDMLAIVRSHMPRGELPEGISAITASILWNLRMPRAVMAFLVGAALSMSGAVMQSVLRNPLASSFTLGVSSGASLSAALVILTGFTLPLVGQGTVILCGFLGGLLTVFLAMAIAQCFDRNFGNTTVILTGMVLSLFVNALLTLVTSFSREHLQQVVFWQMGSFSGQNWGNCALMALILPVFLLVLMHYGSEMDLMTFGEDQAISAGVDLKKVRIILISVSALLTGASVSFVGVIDFVDLIVPHVVRRLFGSRHTLVIPMCALLGGAFMVLADLVARTVVSPRELAIGAVTALIGAPFFAFVYFSRRKGP
ncbi:MAG: iron ABC transporter permease [Clostridia bacterium]|nr:iron ABC transporter permease [Clostridia bacterium]